MLLKGIIQGHAVDSAVLGPHIFTINQYLWKYHAVNYIKNKISLFILIFITFQK